MMTLESIFSYIFFISILILLSSALPHQVPDPAINTYRLLGDATIVLGKQGFFNELTLLTTPWELESELNSIYYETGFCMELSFQTTKISSDCRTSRVETYSQDIYLAGFSPIPGAATPKKATLSIWRDST